MVATATKRPAPQRITSACNLAALEAAVGFSPTINGDRIDRIGGRIRGVKIVGVQSRNKARVLGFLPDQWGSAAEQTYTYGLEGLRAALPIYEGKSVFSNHLRYTYDELGRRVMPPPDSRSNDDLVGWIENCVIVETGNPEVDGIYGDFCVVTTCRMAATIFEIAERNPEKLALSHEAFWNDPAVVDGRIVLTKIDDVLAIALVSVTPGTTNGLFESYTHGETRVMRKTFKILAESHKGTPIGKIALEMIGDPSMAPMGEVSVDVADGTDAEQQIKAGFRALIVACFDDETLDTAGTVAKMKTIMQAYDKVTAPPGAGAGAGDGGGDAGGDDKDAKAKAEEKKKADEAAARVEADRLAAEAAKRTTTAPPDKAALTMECVKLLNGAEITATPVILESMIGLPDATSRETYVRELGAMRVATLPPRSAGQLPAAEAKGGAGAGGGTAPKPMTLDEMAAAFRG